MIVNFQIVKILAKKEEKISKNININYDINIGKIERRELKTFLGVADTLAVHFTVRIDFQPEIGFIEFKGFLNLYLSKEKLEETYNAWIKRKPPEDINNEVLNAIIYNISSLAMEISKSLNLPPALPIPKVEISHNEISPEVA